MPSPSSPLEYRPTPQLILIILFIIFPFIYLCFRLMLTACFMLVLVLKSMFSRVLRFLYEDQLIPVTRTHRRAPPIPVRTAPSTVSTAVQDAETVPAETLSSGETSSTTTYDEDDEELVGESDEEHEKITDGVISPKPETSTGVHGDQTILLEIETRDLHDSENDSGNEEDPSAMSATSTATSATNQTPDLPEAPDNLQTPDAESTVHIRHRNNATRTDGDDGRENPESRHEIETDFLCK